MRKNQGITLLSLVVTIIVLLILAAVSISAIASDNGLVRRSQEAKFKMEATTYKEKTQSTKIPEGQETTEYTHIWTIREKLRSQERILAKGSDNAQDAISLIQVAEGALNETHSILQRMCELTIQLNNSNPSEDQEKMIKEEMDQLKSEIDRIADTTQFNTIGLLNEKRNIDIQLGGEESKQGSISIELDSAKWKDLYGADEIYYTNLTKIQEAVTKVTKQRNKLGALSERLEHTIFYIDNLCENITSLENSIFDTDMKEAMERYQNNDLNAEEELSTGYNNEENATKMAISWETTLGFVRTAEGALGGMHSILQRMNELAVQAENDTNDDESREVIQIIIDELIKEMDRQLSGCVVTNRNLLQGDLQYVEKIDTKKLGISNLYVLTQKDAEEAKKAISDAMDYISKVRANLGNQMTKLERIKDKKADPGYAFDIVNDGKKLQQTEKTNIDGVINSKFTIENGILYYTGTDEFEKKWAQELDIQIKQ